MAATLCAEVESTLTESERRRILIAAAAAAAVGAPVRILEIRPVSNPLDSWTRKSRFRKNAPVPRRRAGGAGLQPAQDGQVEGLPLPEETEVDS